MPGPPAPLDPPAGAGAAGGVGAGAVAAEDLARLLEGARRARREAGLARRESLQAREESLRVRQESRELAERFRRLAQCHEGLASPFWDGRPTGTDRPAGAVEGATGDRAGAAPLGAGSGPGRDERPLVRFSLEGFVGEEPVRAEFADDRLTCSALLREHAEVVVALGETLSAGVGTELPASLEGAPAVVLSTLMRAMRVTKLYASV